MIGGLSGSTTTSGTSHSIDVIASAKLRMRFRDKSCPIIEVLFYSMEGGLTYINKQGERIDAARRYHALLSNILAEQKPA
jgi:hypothetical protein